MDNLENRITDLEGVYEMFFRIEFFKFFSAVCLFARGELRKIILLQFGLLQVLLK
jgi:hypothetical protein